MDISSYFSNCVAYLVLWWVSGLVSSSPHTMSEHEVCTMWKRFAAGISSTADQALDGPGIHSLCKYHPEKCEQLDCAGRSQVEIGVEVHFDYCFGMIMHHCDQPPWLEFILQIPQNNGQAIHRNITHNDSFQVPGLGNNQAAVFLYVEFVKKDTNHFEFSLKAKVRVMYGDVVVWPPNLQPTIIQATPIPVTNCGGKRTTSTMKNLSACNVKSFFSNVNTTFPPDVPSTTTMKPHVKSDTYGKPCDYGNMAGRHCNRNEMCKKSTVTPGVKKANAVCFCQPDYVMSSKTGFCEGEGSRVTNRPWIDYWDTTPAEPKTTPPKDNDSHSRGGNTGASSSIKNNMPLIIGCVVGGVVVVVIVAAIIVIVMKKRGAQYRGRQLLLTEEDTDGAI